MYTIDFCFQADSFSPRFGSGLHPEMSEAEGISNLLREHDQMTTVLRSRTRNLQIVFQTLANKDIKVEINNKFSWSVTNEIIFSDFRQQLIVQLPSRI